MEQTTSRNHFKYRSSPSRNNPVISAIVGKLDHHAIDNCDVKIPTSEFPVESNYDSVTDTYTTLIKYIDDNERDHLLEFFHSEYDDDLLDFDLHICFKLYW